MSEGKTTKPLTTSDVVVWCAKFGVAFADLDADKRRVMVTGCADAHRRAVVYGNVTVYPTQAGRKTPSRSANMKRYSFTRPTEAAAIGRVTGEERRRAAREERLAADEAAVFARGAA